MSDIDIDPEGVTRYGGDCICGPLYTYGGHVEPGQFDPFCPDHGDPEYVASLEAPSQPVGEPIATNCRVCPCANYRHQPGHSGFYLPGCKCGHIDIAHENEGGEANS